MIQKITALVVSMMLLLTSCAVKPDTQPATTPIERNYVATDVTYSEPTAQYAFRLNMDTTETESVKYFFEESIETKDREACIEVTDKVLSNLTLDEVVPEIYIFANDRYSYKNISEHKFYCSIQDWKSVEYVTDVLLVPHKILCKRTSNQTSPGRQAELSFPPLSAVFPEVSPVMRAAA